LLTACTRSRRQDAAERVVTSLLLDGNVQLNDFLVGACRRAAGDGYFKFVCSQLHNGQLQPQAGAPLQHGAMTTTMSPTMPPTMNHMMSPMPHMMPPMMPPMNHMMPPMNHMMPPMMPPVPPMPSTTSAPKESTAARRRKTDRNKKPREPARTDCYVAPRMGTPVAAAASDSHGAQTQTGSPIGPDVIRIDVASGEVGTSAVPTPTAAPPLSNPVRLAGGTCTQPVSRKLELSQGNVADTPAPLHTDRCVARPALSELQARQLADMADDSPMRRTSSSPAALLSWAALPAKSGTSLIAGLPLTRSRSLASQLEVVSLFSEAEKT